MEIFNLPKRCKKTKAAPKTPRTRYHLFLMKQLDKMTGEDRKNYHSIVSKRWKEIKEDPARLSAYNNRARQMKNEAEKSGDDSQNEKMVTERSTVKHPQKVPKIPKFVDTGSITEDEQEPVVKQPKKAPKIP